MIVVVAVIVSCDGDVLLQLRRPHREFPCTWECPGGKLEAGETEEVALRRELSEELAIYHSDITIHDLLGEFSFFPPDVKTPCILKFYNVVLKHDVTTRLRLNDAMAVGWFSRESLKHIQLTLGNNRFFQEQGWI